MKLFSVAIVCYRNFEHVFEAITSVFKQDYPNIELVISDDGSINFPLEKIKQFIKENAPKNIINTILRQEKTNSGTVKHLNHVINLLSGEYICFLACDDTFYDESVLSHYVSGFSKVDSTCGIEMAQTAMFDNQLKNLEGYYLRPQIQRVLEPNVQHEKLFAFLSLGPCLPSTSTCFKRNFFQNHGKFDENYLLIEDIPLHLKIAKEKIKLHYENFIAIKHRNGGISHGANKALTETKLKYYHDHLLYHEQIKRLKGLLATDQYKKARKKIRCEDLWIEYLLYWENSNSVKNKFLFLSRFPLTLFVKFLEKYGDVLGKYWKKLLLLSLGGMISLPDILYTFNKLTTIDLTTIQDKLFFTMDIFLAASLFCLFAQAAGRFIKKMNAFPENLIYLYI